jgi:hypothetical protein
MKSLSRGFQGLYFDRFSRKQGMCKVFVPPSRCILQPFNRQEKKKEQKKKKKGKKEV